jgi:cytochrome c peroxidase
MKKKTTYLYLALMVTIILTVFIAGCSRFKSQSEFKPEIQPLPAQLTNYEAMAIPADNPLTPEKVALGRELWFDMRMSGDGVHSCYGCHVCEKGLTDGLPKAIGAGNKVLTRSSPTLWNIGYHKEFYWDGRSKTLEDQAMAAWTKANMGAKADDVVKTLNGIAGYHQQFVKVFGGDATPANVVKALAAFERTIISGDTAWDKFRGGNKAALSESAQRGWQVFQDAKCTNCHDGVLLTDQQYHNVGIGMDQKEPDVGRFTVTKKPEDTGAFKTPTLRDISKSAPYFHDGSVATLEAAVDFMLGGGKANKYLDKKNLQRHDISKAQRADLLAFLKSLDVDCKLTKPPLP